jgi:hypothetical protein
MVHIKTEKPVNVQRLVIWHEYWYEREKTEEYKKPIFRVKKSNLPKNYATPKGLKTYLSAIRSKIMDPRNRIVEKCNLPPQRISSTKRAYTITERKKNCDKSS